MITPSNRSHITDLITCVTHIIRPLKYVHFFISVKSVRARKISMFPHKPSMLSKISKHRCNRWSHRCFASSTFVPCALALFTLFVFLLSMAKIIQKYGNFTTKELDGYASNAGSCVRKVNSDMHISMGPYGLADFKQSLYRHLVQIKVGFYDFHLNGIVLGIKNIKVLGTLAYLRPDDPALHINIKADFYVFCPEIDVVVSGIVKHVMHKQVSVIIYRVFNVAIRYSNKLIKDEIEMNQEIQFRIKKFDLQSVFPYIEGEILLSESEALSESKNKVMKFEASNNGGDSGFEEKDDTKPNPELDELLSLIKEEPSSPTKDLEASATKKKKKEKKSKRKLSESEVPDETIKINNKKIKKEKKIKEEPFDND